MTGITDAGIVVKSFDEITASLENRFKLEFGETFDTTPESPDGQNIRIMAAFIADQWILAEQAYHAYNVAVVGGAGLDNLVRLNGIYRIVDAPTKVSLRFSATTSVGETVPKGTIVKTADGLEFATIRDLVLPGEVVAECTTMGPIVIYPNEVTKLQGSFEPDITVTNPEAGVTGVTRESDSQLRARRERSIVRTGTATAEAIYAAVVDLNLEFIAVLENDTDETVNGIPPHSFLTVVEGGSLEDVAERIYRNKAIGIKAHGNTIINIKDSQGINHPIGLSRPVQVPVHVRVKVVRPDNVAISSLRVIRDTLVDHVNKIQISKPVEWAKMFAPATIAAPKVNIKTIEISTDGVSWQTSDINISVGYRAITDTTLVTVEEL